MLQDKREGRAHEASNEYWSQVTEGDSTTREDLIAELALKHRVTTDEVRDAVRRWRLNPPLGSARPRSRREE